jgi:hypothetical protein
MQADEQNTPNAASVAAELNQQDLDKERIELDQLVEAQAEELRQFSATTYLIGSVANPIRENVQQPLAYKRYLDQVMEDAGNPGDPIERMLVEQLVLAHHNSARLLMEGVLAEGLEQKKLLNSGSLRLMAEFRHSALALKTYRTASETDHISDDPPLAYSNSNGKDPTKLNGESLNGSARHSTHDTEVESSNRNGHANRITDHLLQEPSPCRSR